MKEPPRSQRWEDRALARFLKEHEDEFAAERLCIVLHNPDEEAKLTKVLIRGVVAGRRTGSGAEQVHNQRGVGEDSDRRRTNRERTTHAT